MAASSAPAAAWIAGRSRWPALLAAPLLAASALLPAEARTMIALLAIIVLGVPHGALDGEIARDVFRPRFGRGWFPVFAIPYLALSGLVLVMWHLAPLCTLAGFLAVSVWHFGAEEADHAPGLERIVRGGLPIALPVLAHPAATAAVFAAVTGRMLVAPPAWWTAGAVAWAVLALVWVGRLAIERRWTALWRPGLLAGAFVALPPLTAFAIYFVCVHAPAHMAAVSGSRERAERVTDPRSAALRAVPLSVMTLLLGAALWPLYQGPVPERLLAVTLQGLAALTLPHMLLELGFGRLRALLERGGGGSAPEGRRATRLVRR